MTSGAEAVVCSAMTAATRGAAERVLGAFLDGDAHYRASAASYGDGGPEALGRALDLFLARPALGFVWIAQIAAGANAAADAVGACVVCYAISTARGSLVAKLDDVAVASSWQGRGVGSAMLGALAAHLRSRGVTRIDSSCHRGNDAALRFYERLGFRKLDEERIALILWNRSDERRRRRRSFAAECPR
ncbi:MAG TPA: GNAT family N-acetyltransferase [Casimicrobiaceae bacterium]